MNDKADTAIDYFDDIEVEAPPATIELLINHAEEARELEREILKDSIALSEKQDKLDKILRGYIPDIMKALRLEDFKLEDGSKITVKDDVKAHISEENKPIAHGWLRENDYDGIIKTEVTVNFGKGESADAERAREALIAAGFTDAEINDSVHHSTLKSFVKERLVAGDNIPLDVFGVFEFRVAKIELPKTPTARKQRNG